MPVKFFFFQNDQSISLASHHLYILIWFYIVVVMPKTASPKKAGSTAAKRKVGSLEINKRLRPSDTKRKVVKVTRFAETPESKVAKEIVIPKGKGKKLGDLPNVASLIAKRTRNDLLLRTLHNVLLGRVNKKIPVKDNLLAFNGVVFDDVHTRQKLEQKLETLAVPKLKNILAFFGQEHKGKKDELIPQLADFLEKPKASDTVYEVAIDKKRKRSESPKSTKSKSTKSKTTKTGEKKKRAKKDPNAPKKALSGYFFFIKDHREELKKKHPTYGIADLAKKLGEAWNNLSATEKKPFLAKSEKDKERYEKEMKKYKSSKA